MKKKLSAFLALTLACVLGLSSAAVLADGETGRVSSSEEVIYASLLPDGTPRDAYAVIILNVEKTGSVAYAGSFTSVRNLTDTGALTYENGLVTGLAPAGRFYLQGNLADPRLPWDIAVAYTLDGKAVAAADLPGAEGALEIHITTAAKPAADSRFFDHYLLQVSLTLDAGRCENIAAEGATLANSGADKLVTFTVLPGKDGDMTVTADVTDFAMDGITISAVPYSAGDALGDLSGLTDGVDDLSDAISQLADGAAQLADGTLDLSVGASQLKKGAASYGDGLTRAAGGSGGLVSASGQILSALGQLAGGLSGQEGGADLSALSQLPAGLSRLADALDQVSGGMTSLTQGFSAANAAMAAAVASIPAAAISEAELGALAAANPDSAALGALMEHYKAARTIRATWAQVSPAFTAAETTLPTLAASADTVSQSLRSMAAQMSSALQSDQSLAGLSALAQGLAGLNENYAAFHEGLTAYTAGVEALAQNWAGLETGVSELSSGAYILSKGAAELSDGVGTLNEETKDLPGQVEELTEGLTSDFEPASFLSQQNENTGSVQFVIKTDAIEAPEAPADNGDLAASSSLWDRIKALFHFG